MCQMVECHGNGQCFEVEYDIAGGPVRDIRIETDAMVRKPASQAVRVLSLTKDTLNLSCTKQSMTQSIGDYTMLMR